MRSSENVVTTQKRWLTCVLSADICNYSGISEFQETSAVEIARFVAALLEKSVKTYGGRVFHSAGDGFMAEFPSAHACLDAAIEFQAGLAESERPDDLPDFKVRIGLHVGDVVSQPNGDLLGHGVNVAARVQSAASPGALVVSENFFNLVPHARKSSFRSLGQVQLKNLSQTLGLYEFESEEAPVRKSFGWKVGIIASALMVFCSFGVWAFSSNFGVSSAPPQELDRRAIRKATEVLTFANRPVDAAIAALVDTNDFNASIDLLQAELDRKREILSPRQQIDLMHQAAALSFDRDDRTAKELYRQILLLDPDDWVAAFQLAQIYLLRSERSEALTWIDKALEEDDLSKLQQLRLDIDKVRITVNDPAERAVRFADIARLAKSEGAISVELLSSFYMLSSQGRADRTAGALSAERAGELIDAFEELIDRQLRNDEFSQVSLSHNGLAGIYDHLEDYPAAQAEIVAMMEYAILFDSPSGLLSSLYSLASMKLELGDPYAAYGLVLYADAVSRKADLVYAGEYRLERKKEISDTVAAMGRDCGELQTSLRRLRSDYPILTRTPTPTSICAALEESNAAY